MKRLLSSLILLLSCTLVIAQTAPKKKTTTTSKSGGTKYVFVVVGVNQPEFDAEFTDKMNSINNYTTFKRYYKPNIIYYTSEIITLSNFSEERKYRLIDKIRTQAYDEYVKFYNSAMTSEEARRSIVSTKANVFNSYKEASLARSGDTE